MPSGNKQRFWLASFVLQITRGLVRDQSMRRQVMAALIGGALLCMVGGSTFLESALDPREHWKRFLFYWLICAWLTFTAALLALFDVLAIRARSRAERRLMKEKLATDPSQKRT